MGGEPFKVGRFAHTLRVRLMREHLGVDVDALPDDDLASEPVKPEHEQEEWNPDTEHKGGQRRDTMGPKAPNQKASVNSTTAGGMEQG
jgi:phospholipase D1/2